MHKYAQLGLGMLALLALATLAAGGPQPGRQATPPPGEAYIEVPDQASVRDGPGTQYDRVGVLISGQIAPVIGRSAEDNRWVQIVYIGGPDNKGWVYLPNVRLVGDPLAIPSVIPPPTPTLPPTSTSEIFLPLGPATPGPNANRLPTFTPPGPAIRPTLLPLPGEGGTVAFPPALLILALFVLGSFAALLSLLRQR